MNLLIIGILTILSKNFILTEAHTMEEKIRGDPDLSQFYDLLDRNAIAKTALQYRQLTIFAPTNRAFQRYEQVKTNVLYHISTVATTLENLGTKLLTDLEGNLPLYITRKKVGREEEIYINNAKVIKSRSNNVLYNAERKKQVLHIIDDILQPISVNPSSHLDFFNPDAYQFMQHSESLDIGDFRIRSFRQRVNLNKQERVYQEIGGHTFFIPVEEGFIPPPRSNMIDKKVIHGHIIPNKVIFTGAAQLEHPENTLASDDNLRVTISLFTQKDGKATKTYVKSHTHVGDSTHVTGVVLAEIVKANIPLINGVVHLISRPLMIVDSSVIQFLEEKEDGPLYKFWEAINDNDFKDIITRMRDVTLFAPSNEAWNDANLNNILRQRDRMREIINLHIVKDRLNTDKIKQNHLNQIFQIPTLENRKFLYFNILTNRDRNQTVTVEGGGVNATIIQADIAALNGYVHIIDRVLGVPYSTVLEKLRTDPMLKTTFNMGTRAGFTEQLNDKLRRYTFFVPRDKAWQNSESVFPAAHRNLLLPQNAFHTSQILGRHLVIGDRAYTMTDLKMFLNETEVLPTTRGSLRLRVKEDDRRYSILYNDRWIPVYRPDVECTNGIIHVIDFPFLEYNDVVVSGAATILPFVFGALVRIILFAKLLL